MELNPWEVFWIYDQEVGERKRFHLFWCELFSYIRLLLKLDIKWLGNVTHFVYFSQVHCLYTGDFSELLLVILTEFQTDFTFIFNIEIIKLS